MKLPSLVRNSINKIQTIRTKSDIIIEISLIIQMQNFEIID
jgi:hypothetical protein